MKLAFSSNAYTNFSIEETIARLRRPAIAGSRFWPTCLMPGRPDCSRNANSRFADSLAQHRLTISNINAFMMNAVADPRQAYWHPAWIDLDPLIGADPPEHTKRSKLRPGP